MASFEGDGNFSGNVTAATVDARSGKHASDYYDAQNRRKAQYNTHQRVMTYQQSSGAAGATAIVDDQQVIGTFFGDASGLAIRITPEVAPDAGTSKYTVQVLISIAGAAYTSILSGGTAIDVDDDNVSRVAIEVVPTTTTAAAGSSLKVVIDAVAGTGTQGIGVVVDVRSWENPAVP